jgi:phosphoribosylformylglycinamidine cyclo-ligase
LPAGLGVQIDLDSWDLPAVFRWLAATGGMQASELLKTFNCGIGMVLAVSANQAEALKSRLTAEGETVHTLGRVISGPQVIYGGTLL